MLHTINIIFTDVFFIYAGKIKMTLRLMHSFLVKIRICQENSDDRGDHHF